MYFRGDCLPTSHGVSALAGVGVRPANRKKKYVHKHIQVYTPLYSGDDIKYHMFISVVVIELSVRCLNTGPEDILGNGEVIKYHIFISVIVIELSVRCLDTGPKDG